jgi:hypothetical protein
MACGDQQGKGNEHPEILSQASGGTPATGAFSCGRRLPLIVVWKFFDLRRVLVMEWRQIAGGFLLGIFLGSGIVWAIKDNTVTVCTCTPIQGGLRWNPECPADVVNHFSDRTTCP